MNTKKTISSISEQWKGIAMGLFFSLGLIFLPTSILVVPVIIVSLIAIFLLADLKSSSGNILFFVPKMHAFVRRNRFFSNNGEYDYDEEPKPNENEEERKERKDKIKAKRKPRGYKSFKEGLAWKIPGLHVNEGLICLEPKQKDIKEMVVNSSDKQPVVLDLQITTSITDPERFVINMPGETIAEKEKNRETLINDLLHTAANSACTSYNSEQLQARMLCFDKKNYENGPEDWKELETELKSNLACKEAQKRKDATDKKWNKEEIMLDKKDDWEKFFKKNSYSVPIDLGYEIKLQLYSLRIKEFYGISVNQVGVQKIYNPPEIQKALEKEKTAEINKRFSQVKGKAAGEEMGEAIKETAHIAGINPHAAAFVYGLAKFFTPKSGNKETAGGPKK